MSTRDGSRRDKNANFTRPKCGKVQVYTLAAGIRYIYFATLMSIEAVIHFCSFVAGRVYMRPMGFINQPLPRSNIKRK